MTLHTNFFPISFQNDQFSINRLPYSPSKLTELREKYNISCSFFRNGDFIYLSPMSDFRYDLGEKYTSTIGEDKGIISSLIKHIFFRVFRDNFSEIIPLSFYPFRFFSRVTKDDLIYHSLPPDLQNLVSFKKQIEIEFRNIEISNENKFGALINCRFQWDINKNCKQLYNEGFNLLGSNVLFCETIPGLKGILAPDESLIGSVVSIENDSAIIESNFGRQKYDLENLSIQKTPNNLKEYLNYRIGKGKTTNIFENLKYANEDRLNTKKIYEEILSIAKTISKLEFKNNNGFQFFIDAKNHQVTNSFGIQPTNYLFDYNPGKSATQPSNGLSTFGPYDSATFDSKDLKVLVICHKSNRGAFSDFCGKLRDGIPTSKIFRNGMIGKYCLHNIHFVLQEIDDYSKESYENGIRKSIESSSSLPNLAIIETSDSFRKLPLLENPYYLSKAYLLNLGVPIQFIKNEKIRQDDISLQWIIESIALQIYAKLGGVPWVLPSSSSIDHELIIGIGSSLHRNNLLAGGTQNKYVGITTFFTGDGKYICSKTSKDVEYDEYFDEMLSTLKNSINEISDEYGWQEHSTVRITFHIFKQLKNKEADIVEKLVNSYPQYNIKYCFVTITDNNSYMLFDTEQPALDSKTNKGIYIPARSSNWIIDSKCCIIQILGAKEIKTSKHKLSHPLMIKIHEKSTYTDLNTVVQQVFNFTNLSWRGFNPSQTPVTILYSDLIASQLSALRQFKSWKPELLHLNFRSKKWFL